MNQDTVVNLATQAMTLALEVAGPILILEAGRGVEAGERASLAADPASRLSRMIASANDGALS